MHEATQVIIRGLGKARRKLQAGYVLTNQDRTDMLVLRDIMEGMALRNEEMIEFLQRFGGK